MKVSNLGALAGALVLVAGLAPAGAVQAQSRDRLFRTLEIGHGARIGASVDDADNKDAKAGVVIETVDPGGPADKAGIKTGDSITEFDGERVRSVRQFLRLVQETTPGRSVAVVLSRAGQRGVLVKSVAADSVAAKAGVKAGDVITAVNGRKVYDSSDVTRAIDRTESNGDVTIEVTRDKKTQTLKGKLETRDESARTRVRTIV